MKEFIEKEACFLKQTNKQKTLTNHWPQNSPSYPGASSPAPSPVPYSAKPSSWAYPLLFRRSRIPCWNAFLTLPAPLKDTSATLKAQPVTSSLTLLHFQVNYRHPQTPNGTFGLTLALHLPFFLGPRLIDPQIPGTEHSFLGTW